MHNTFKLVFQFIWVPSFITWKEKICFTLIYNIVYLRFRTTLSLCDEKKM